MEPNQKRNIIIGIILFIFLVGGLGVGLFLVNQKQDVRSKASTDIGTAIINLSPTTGNITAGSSLPITISVNPSGNVISALAIRINYSYSGTTPGLTAENFQISQTLISSGDWTCPVKKFTATGGKANIDIACANTSTIGYSGSGVINLATVSLTASASAANATYTLAFDPKESIITKKSDSTDILLTPNSQGTYTVTGTGIAHKYSCNTAGTCVQNDATGIYADANCNSSCVPPVIHKYSCNNSSCVLDDTLGTFSDANCNNSCQPVTTLPETGNPLLTFGIAAIGVIFSLTSFLFLRH